MALLNCILDNDYKFEGENEGRNGHFIVVIHAKVKKK